MRRSRNRAFAPLSESLRLLALVALTGAAIGAAGQTPTRTFEPAAIADWQRRDFSGETVYRLVEADGRSAVRAVADGSASALYREIEVDPEATPLIEWSWRIERAPTGDAAESSKAGDDYAARLYLVREGLFGKLSANALNYVRARAQPVGAIWPNAYSGRARMLAVGSGREVTGTWVTHRRDIRADWREAFGETIERIDGLAIMTDADDTNSRARALYGTIRFLPDEAQ